MTSSITAKTCEAWFLLEAADLRGLPAPFDVSVTDYGPTKLGLRTVDDLSVWADALNAHVTCREVAARFHWTTEGTLHDLPVSLFVVTSLAEVAS